MSYSDCVSALNPSASRSDGLGVRTFRRTAVWGALAGLPLVLLSPLAPSQAAGTYSTGKVLKVYDGDTIGVDQNRDGRIDARVRLVGLDTPEKGLCGADKATRALASLVGKKIVSLTSNTGAVGIRNRPERRVIVSAGGRKVDASTWMLERGWGVWMPRAGETAWSKAQHAAADRAAAAGLGWFDEDRCGVGPAPEGTLSMQVQYLSDAADKLSDAEVRNQEFVRIRNDGTEPVSIDGWTLRVGNDRSQRVPAGGPIPPGEAVTIHVGFGTNSALHRYLGSSVPMLVNAELDGDPRLGSGSYLIDPHNDIRAHSTWPCTLSCADPTGGALVLSEVPVDPPGTEFYDLNLEYVALTNRGSTPIRTGDMVLEVWPWVYEFPTGHFLDPGETMRVYGGAGTDDRLTRYIDAKVPILPNDGGRVLLRTYDAVVVECQAWGTGSCPRTV